MQDEAAAVAVCLLKHAGDHLQPCRDARPLGLLRDSESPPGGFPCALGTHFNPGFSPQLWCECLGSYEGVFWHSSFPTAVSWTLAGKESVPLRAVRMPAKSSVSSHPAGKPCLALSLTVSSVTGDEPVESGQCAETLSSRGVWFVFKKTDQHIPSTSMSLWRQWDPLCWQLPHASNYVRDICSIPWFYLGGFWELIFFFFKATLSGT